jgi:hypothetical protein
MKIKATIFKYVNFFIILMYYNYKDKFVIKKFNFNLTKKLENYLLYLKIILKLIGNFLSGRSLDYIIIIF